MMEMVKQRSDEELLAEYLGGQTDRFELLVRRYAQELFHFVYRLIGRSAAAEDIVQETFVQVHQSAATFDPQRKFRPWIFTIAANKGRDQLRAQQRRPEVHLEALATSDAEPGSIIGELLGGSHDQPTLQMETEEQSFQIRQLVESMPANLKEVLILGYYHGFAYQEIADMLQVPLGTVKSRLHTAVTTFGRLYSARYQEEPLLRNDENE
ncbi:MAG: ECF RNA polymerase sigma factor SigW [Phycisphaerae bacterium]|nr:ECF RNA polymerase sigma factor SigW [Phycisphaerae bacterium]